MRLNKRFWYCLTLLVLVGAVWLWVKGNQEMAGRKANRAAGETPKARQGGQAGKNGTSAAATGKSPVGAAAAGNVGGTAGASPGRTPGSVAPGRFPYRLSNTDRPLSELGRSDTAILLDNAFIDTASRTPVSIPEHLRSNGDPRSYLVQSGAALNAAFYRRLREAGAEFVSYIPNNTALVRLSAEGARRLAGSAGRPTVVLPYEPYYKLAQPLLALAVERQSLPLDRPLNVTLFAGEKDSALAAMRDLGAEVLGEERTPFGPMLTINAHPDSLPALAQLTAVQRIEYASGRTLLNDLARVRLQVSLDTVAPTNYLELTGAGVTLNINDTGVDASHPDLIGRVFSPDTNAFVLADREGHGTHVAGTIMSNGSNSVSVLDVNTNPPSGSLTNASFRGMAPEANLVVLPIDLRVGPLITDTYLQETAATNNYSGGRSYPLLSNNSWAYNGAFEYNSSCASYDAAVRDALPDVTGSQSILYVFAAGNSGFGNTNGTVGEPDSIPAPASAKNVITVGAIESFRTITNEFHITNVVDGTNMVTTNAPFLGFTDSDNEVASFSSRGNVGIGTEGDFGRFKPDVVAPGTFIVSTLSQNIDTNNLNPLVPTLGKYYRYETGTSMSAGVVSGMLALVQEFFEQRLKRAYSPALLKALLINGARSVNPNYDLSGTNVVNLQGWGVVNLTNSLPGVLANGPEDSWPIRFIDQSPANAIATGQRHTWNVELSTNAVFVPLRATLVWTDPPGNPGAGIKLVNDLDLIVTNLDSGQVYLGNGIPVGFDFNQAIGTNASVQFDFVNNVENVFVGPQVGALLGTRYSITVVGRRVSVNAVTANTTDVVQDYALVISSGNGEVTNAFVSLTRANNGVDPNPAPIGLTNGMPLLKQRVGANFQLAPSTNGEVSQWRFYVFTNFFFTNNFSGLTNGSNVAFITFLPPDLSRPRNLDADIDLYVSTNAGLLNLDAAVIAGAWASTNRGGTELVVFTNAAVGLDKIYYIGVKSEDQQGAEFGIVGLSTDLPFDASGSGGSRILRALPPSVEIPDGSPPSPGGALMFAVGIQPAVIARAIVTNDITHQGVGDLLGNLSHENHFTVLNNHNSYRDNNDSTIVTNFHLVFDDSNGGQFNLSRPSDGPGSLNNFIGERSSGVWLFTMTDDALGRTGRVDNLTIRVDPAQSLTNLVNGSVLPNQWAYYFVDVPDNATRLTVTLSGIDGRLNLYLRRGLVPTTTDYDKFALIDPPGGSLSIGLGDVPPLNGGRYFIGVFNPNSATVNFTIRADVQLDLMPRATGDFLSDDTPTFVFDDAISRSSIFVPVARQVEDVRVGVRIDDARASDLVLHLVSPQGTRVLLTENRGRTNAQGYGISESLATNTVNLFTNSFETAPVTNYFVGDVLEGWKVAENVVSVRADRTLAYDGTNVLVLRGGHLTRVLPTTAGRSYRLDFAYWLNQGQPRGAVAWWPVIGGTASDIVGGHGGVMSGVGVLPGIVGNAFSFDGVSSVITVPDAAVFDLTTDYTLEFWLNPDPAQQPFANIVRKEHAPDSSGFGIAMDGATNSNFYYAGWKNSGSAPGDECWTRAGFQLTPGMWQHVAVVKTNATRLVYINGTLVGSATCAGTTNTVGVNNAPLEFGAWSGAAGSAWKGLLDEMTVYNRALTPEEIGDIVLSGSFGKCADVIPPVTCSAGAAFSFDGIPTAVVAGNLYWRTASISFTALKNGTVADITPIGGGMLLDDFVLVENQVTTRPFYTVFTEDTNLALVPIKFAAPPFTNSAVVTSLTNQFVVNDGFENSSNGTFSAGQFVSGWQVSTGQVTVFGIPNPLGYDPINLPNGWPPVPPGTNFLALNGGWSSTGTNGFITNWIPGSIITNFSTTVNGQCRVSFATARALGPAGLFIPTNPPVLVVLTNGEVAMNLIVTDPVWTTNTFTFTPDQPLTSLEFRSFTTNGVLLDQVQVTELVDEREAYFLPEESLDAFVGEPAFGDWTLEILDNRVGLDPSPRPPLLLTWKLDFVFANTNASATPLTFCPDTTNVASVYDTNCVAQTNVVTGDQIKYFIVNVPRRAMMATNILAGTGDLVLLYSTNGLPTGALPGDYFVNNNPAGLGETLLLTTNVPPGFELQPGQRYYLGVANVNPTDVNTFTISVAFDQTDTNLVSAFALTNGFCYTTTIAATNALDYYQFTVSTNATAVTFQLAPANGNVDLVVRRATPVPDPLPAPNVGRYDYISQNPGTNIDQIIVTTNSQPVALAPGLWYLGVYNQETNPVTYTICATESGGPLYNIIPLTNNVPLDFTIAAGSALTNFFVFTIDQTNAMVSFTLYNLTAPAELLVNLDGLPDDNNYLFNASGFTNSPAQILADTNYFPPVLNGDWYLAVENLDTNDLSFTLLVSLSTNDSLVINPQIIFTNGSLCLSWNSVVGQDYHVEGKTNLTDPTWTVISPTITATNTTTIYCVPITGQQFFLRVVQGAAAAPGLVINFSSLTMAPGGFVLNWTAPVADRFQVQYAANLPPAWVTFTNVVTSTTGNFSFTDDGTQSGGLSATRFYRLILLP
jgi:subtilisin family serine protease/subtilisin-like proprotein convertase family protein